MALKQVADGHYEFQKYINKNRWISLWYQLDEILSLAPRNVLEIGPGHGLFQILAGKFGVEVKTVDIDTDLKPDYVCSADDLAISDNSYDIVVAFQMLEHLPYDKSLCAFEEMVRVASKYIVISLPDAKPLWDFVFKIPKFGEFRFMFPHPRLCAKTHEFDGEHYWEINKHDYLVDKVINDFAGRGAKLVKTYRVKENTYHRFFIFEKTT